MNQGWLFTLDQQCRPNRFVFHGIWICDISTASCCSYEQMLSDKYICHMCTAGTFSRTTEICVIWRQSLQILLRAFGFLYVIHISNKTVHQCINMHNNPFKGMSEWCEWMIKNEWDARHFTAINESKQGKHLLNSCSAKTQLHAKDFYQSKIHKKSFRTSIYVFHIAPH